MMAKQPYQPTELDLVMLEILTEQVEKRAHQVYLEGLEEVERPYFEAQELKQAS